MKKMPECLINHIDSANTDADLLYKAAVENGILRKGIEDYIRGDYLHPRKYRPKNCPHGVYYWDECEQCNVEHFQKVLDEVSHDHSQIKS